MKGRGDADDADHRSQQGPREGDRRAVDALGHTVWIGARDPEKGAAAADELGARFVQLDVTDDASVAAAAATVATLDVLINNAGISGGFVEAADTTAEHVREVFETNVFGVVRVMQAFLPLLADPGVVVNVGSGLGSLAVTTDPTRIESTRTGLAYNASKSALNMLTSQYAKNYPHLRINVAEPGYTATDLNGFSGTQSIHEGTDAIAHLATLGPDGPTGGYFSRDGAVPW